MSAVSFKGLFRGNPMLAEIEREKKRALAEHNWKGGQLAVRVLIAVFYAFFLVLTLMWIEVIEPFVVLYILLGLATVVLPANLHGAIAGERENRSLDMLLVAPVTPAQIVVGKFSRSLLAIGMLVVFIGLPAFFIELIKQTDSPYSYGMKSNGIVGYFTTLLFVIVASLLFGAITIWISSKTKTKTGAMLGTIGALFVYLIVLPAIGGVMTFVSPDISSALIDTNPYTLTYWAYMGIPEPTDYQYSYTYPYEGATVHPAIYVWPTMIGMALLTVLFVVLAVANLQKIALGRSE